MTTFELALFTFRASALATAVALCHCLVASDEWSGMPDAVFEYRGSEKNLDLARDAAQEWNAVCGTRLSVVVPPDTGDVTLTEVPVIGGGHGGVTHYRGPPKRASAVEFVDGEWTYAILLHEMGHVLGRGHDDTRAGVMNEEVSNANARVTIADCAGVHR